jgi:hypothetical protein
MNFNVEPSFEDVQSPVSSPPSSMKEEENDDKILSFFSSCIDDKFIQTLHAESLKETSPFHINEEDKFSVEDFNGPIGTLFPQGKEEESLAFHKMCGIIEHMVRVNSAESSPESEFTLYSQALLDTNVTHGMDAETKELANKFLSSMEEIKNDMRDLGSKAKFAAENNVVVSSLSVKKFGIILVGIFVIARCATSESSLWKKLLMILVTLDVMKFATLGESSTLTVATVVSNVRGMSPVDTESPETEAKEKFFAQGSDFIATSLQSMYQAFSIYTIDKKPGPKMLEGLAKRLSTFKRVNDGIVDALEWTQGTYKYFVNSCKRALLGEKMSDIVEGVDNSITNWCKQVEYMEALSNKGRLELTAYNAQRLYTLILQSRRFLLDDSTAMKDSRVRHALKVYVELLTELNKPFKKLSKDGSGPRAEPFVIIMKGDSGVGKSWFSNPFVIMLLKRILDPEQLELLAAQPGLFTYCRQPEHIYWDGYIGQFVTIFDDFGQVRNIPGAGESEFMDLIRCANMFQHLCHMAHLDDKGVTYFTSRLIVATSNMHHIQCESLIQPEAVKRRFDVVIDVFVSKEYAQNPYDIPGDRVFNPALKQEFSTKAYEFHVRSSYDGPVAHIFNCEQLIDYCVDKYKIKDEKSEKYLAYLRDLVNFDSMDFDMSIDDLEAYVEEEEQPICVNEDPIWLEVRAELRKGDLHQVDPTQLIVFLDNKYPEAAAKLRAKGPKHYARIAVKLLFKHVHLKTELQYGIFQQKRKTFYDQKQYMQTYVASLYQKMLDKIADRPCLSYAIKMVPILGVLVVAYSAIKYLDRKEDDPDPQSHNGKPHRRGRRDLIRKERMFVQGAFSQLSDKLMGKAMYSMRWPGTNQYDGSILFVRGTTALIPRHYVDLIDSYVIAQEGDEIMTFENCVGGKTFTKKMSELTDAVQSVAFNGLDMALLNVPGIHFPNIVSSFINESFIKKERTKTQVCLLSGLKAGSYNHGTATMILNQSILPRPAKLFPEVRGWNVDRGWKYSFPTTAGMCGSVLINSEPEAGNQRIMGIHVAGGDAGKGFGLASVLTQELINEALDLIYEPLAQCSNTPTVKGKEKVHFVAQSNFNFEVLRKLPKPVMHCSTTRYRKSPLYDTWGPAITRPAYLSKFVYNDEVIDPYELARDKYKPTGGNMFIDPDAVRGLAYYFSDLYRFRVEDRTDLGVLSFEEAIVGIPALKYYDSIPRQTSAGLPYVLDPKPGFSGKQWYFGKEDEYDLSTPAAIELKKEVLQIIEDCKSGYRTDFVYVDNLKDECLPHEKVLRGKTRLFCCAPLALTVVTRMYFLTFSAFLMENKIQNGCAVGINCYSTEWSELSVYVQEVGLKLLAGDFRSFDASHKCNALEYMGDALINFMGGTDTDRVIRKVLWYEVSRSKHARNDTVYQWVQGLSSGHTLTSIINSIFVNWIFRTGMYIVLNPLGYEHQHFNSHFRVIAYGDDSILGVSDKVSELINFIDLVNVFAKLGYTFTNGDKNQNDTPYTTIDKVMFLKRGFKYNPCRGIFMSPLELDVILETPYWVRKGNNAEIVTSTNVQFALRELTLHGEEIFYEWSKRIIEASKQKLLFSPPVTEYEPLLNECMTLENY